jgi:mono/diheme cytochrome c family protein
MLDPHDCTGRQPARVRSRLGLLLGASMLVALASACAGLGASAPDEAAGVDAGGSGPGAGGGGGDRASGAKLYGQLCASCHGQLGEGGVGKPIAGWTRGEAELVSIIDARMPTTDPSRCTGACAADVAAYILAELKGGAATCSEAPLLPRRLRLLSRREYEASVRDLLSAPGTSGAGGAGGATGTGGACKLDADCAIESESCVGGACAKDPCNLRTFVFSPGSKTYKSVHVAGDFNGWPATIGGGGWALGYVASKGIWAGKHVVDSGGHQYKLVLDEATWVVDPGNPKKSPDGFGGDNSVLDVACPAGGQPGGQGQPVGLPADLTKGFPVESRPKGFAFDDSADGGLVTSVHVDQYMKAASAIAAQALDGASALVPCQASTADAACAEALVRQLGRRAFRRPLAEPEVARYKALFGAQAAPESGLRVVLEVMLSSPHFLYRSELGEPQPDGTYRLTPYEIAGALSYQFWGTSPDPDLLLAAEQGDLSTPDGIEVQARRLLADPRSRAVAAAFALQWLGVERITGEVKSQLLFPTFEHATGVAMAEETSRFFTHVVFDGSHRLDELFTADYTFVDQPLAAFYGLPAPSGGAGQWGKVSLPPARRAGVLAHGSILGSYAHSDQTSPIRRGVFVRETLLCQPLGTPPPQAGGVPKVDPNATTRERFRQHTDNPVCKTCHQYIDPVGFGFEGFDAVGRPRDTEGGVAIDATGDLTDVERLGAGTHAAFDGLPQLAAALVSSEQLHACFALQYYRFAHGALEGPADACALQGIREAFDKSGHDVQELMVAVTRSPSFWGRK